MRVTVFIAASLIAHLLLLSIGGDISLLPSEGFNADPVTVAVVTRSSFAPAPSPASRVQKTLKPKRLQPHKYEEATKPAPVEKVRPEPVVVPAPVDAVAPEPPLPVSVDVDDSTVVEEVVPEALPTTSDIAVATPVKEGSSSVSDVESDVLEMSDSVGTDLPGVMDGGADTTSSIGTHSATPRYDVNPRPKYPRVARSRGWEGVVSFEVVVLRNGRVGGVELLSSSGYRSLDRAARAVLRRWVFTPATEMGLPVESKVTVPIRFSLTTL